jgi:hypothetical protein
VKEPSRKVIREWIDEWAEGGNDSGWSPYKSVVVNWGKRGQTYYYKLADAGRYDVDLAPDCNGLYVCGGGGFWKVARMWDTLLALKKHSMLDDIEAVPGLTSHQRLALKINVLRNYEAALREKERFCELRRARHGASSVEDAYTPPPAATLHKQPTANHKKPATTVHKKPATPVHKKPAATVSKRPAALGW